MTFEELKDELANRRGARVEHVYPARRLALRASQGLQTPAKLRGAIARRDGDCESGDSTVTVGSGAAAGGRYAQPWLRGWNALAALLIEHAGMDYGTREPGGPFPNGRAICVVHQ
jgi:hypothetical protein